jgi:hypothetical protein
LCFSVAVCNTNYYLMSPTIYIVISLYINLLISR